MDPDRDTEVAKVEVPAALVEETAEDLYENAPCGYLSTSLPTGLIVRVNATFLAWTGFTREELVGRKRFQDLLTAGGRIFHETHYAPLLRMQGTVREIAVDIVRADGSRLPALVNSVLRRDDAGEPAGVRTTIFNATDRKGYEEELLRARQRSESSAARLRILQEAVAELAGAATSTDIANVVAAAGVRAFDAVRSATWLRDDDTGEPHEVAVAPAPPAGSAPTVDDAVRVAFGEREPVVVPWPDADGTPPEPAPGAAPSGAAVLVPLVGKEHALGVVRYDFGAPHPFDRDELDVLRALGRQAGQALERARLYEAERQLREQSEVMQRITAYLAAALTPAGVAAAVVDEMVGRGLADKAAFALVDSEAQRLDVVGARGFGDEALARWRHVFDVPARPTVTALVTREPLFLDSHTPSQDPAHDLSSAVLSPGLSALAILPLVVERRAIGVLALGYLADRTFGHAERTFFASLAGQCAQALERARLQEETARREERAAFLAETSRVLEEARSYVGRARRLVGLMASRVALAASVEAVTATGALERVAAATRDGDVADPLLDPLDTTLMDDVRTTALAAAANGETRAVEVVAGDAAQARSYVVLPLRAGDRVPAVLVLARAANHAGPDPLEREFLDDLADRAGLSLANARLYEQERDIAHTLQQSLLASDLPRDPRAAIATRYRPAIETLEVGGDWYDAFRVTDGVLAVVVGDVVGRGIDAASAMGQVRSAIRALAVADLGPAGVLRRLDRFVEHASAGRMATLVYAEIDLASGRTCYACAGHPPPLLLEPGAAPRFLWDARSTPLGAADGLIERTETEFHLLPGTRLVLYTDGLVERRDRAIDEGLDRLADEAAARRTRPLELFADEITDAMLADEQGRDDVCLICLAFGAADFATTLPAVPSSLSRLRAGLDEWLATYGVTPSDRELIVLSAGEAASNAIEHGSRAGDIEITLTAHIEGPVAEVVVSDNGTWREPSGQPDRGRGFELMRRLMDEVVVVHDGGTTVTLRRAVTFTRRPE